MTVETTSGGEPIVKSGPYTGDGVTTSFDYDFQIQDEAELVVTRQNADGTEAVLTITTDYTVSGVSNDAGGSITLTAGSKAPSGSKIVIQYDGLYTQSVDYSNQGRIQLSLLEQSLDKLMMHCRSLKEIADRAVTVDAFDTVDVDTLRANINALAAIESDITTVAGDIAVISAVSGNSANINTVAGISANVTTVAGIAANVTTVAGAIANVNTVATNIADINTVAGIVADITAVAANATNISTVAGMETDITNVLAIQADIATVASLETQIITLASGTGGTVTGTWDFDGTVNFLQDVNFTGTGAIKLPVGTTLQRPGTPAKGDARFNDTTGQYEAYNGTQWGPLGGAGLFKGENGESGDTVGGAGDIFRVHEQTLNTNTTIDADENAVAAGPLAVASGVTLTVTSGGNLVVV